MEFRKLIENRKSVRKFLLGGKKVDWRIILRAIDYARFVPAAGNQYNLKFILVSNTDLIKQIAEACQQSFISKAEYVVICVSDSSVLERLYGERADRYTAQTAGAAIENFLLGLTNEGLATTWVGYYYEDMIKTLLKIPDKLTIEAVFPIGIEAKNSSTKEKVKMDLENIVYFDKWGNKYMEPISKVTSDGV
jgi:nitroreductase